MPLSAWVTVAGRGQPGISKANAGSKTAWRRVRHRARNAGRLGPLPLNALPCDFDDASSCRINHGKLGRSERLPGVDGRGILYGEAPGQIGRTGTIKLIEEENSRQTASNLSGQVGTPRAGGPNAILGNGARSQTSEKHPALIVLTSLAALPDIRAASSPCLDLIETSFLECR